MSRVRIAVSLDDADLAAIDAAAESAGEDRSAYLCRAALERAGASGGALSKAQEQAVERIVKRMLKH